MAPREKATVERELFLRSLAGVQPRGNVTDQLVRAMHEVSYAAGETLFEAGQISGLMHFIRSGEVELRAPDADPWRLSPPSVIGVLDLLQGGRHARTAVAVTEIHALAMRTEDWLDVLEENFDFNLLSIKRVAADLHALHLSVPPGGAFRAPPAPAPDQEPHALNLMERTLALRKVELLSRANVQSLASLALLAEERSFQAGEAIFHRGDPSGALCVVESGIVRATHPEPQIEARFGAGSIVGGSAALSFEHQAYDAVAETSALLIHLRKEDLFDLAEDNFELAQSLLGGMAGERVLILEERARRQKAGEALAGSPYFVDASKAAVPGRRAGS